MTPYQNSTSVHTFIYIHNMSCLLLVNGLIFSKGCISLCNRRKENEIKLSFNAHLSNSCCFVHFRKPHSLGNEKKMRNNAEENN